MGNKMNNKDFIGQFRGKEIYTVLDKELDTIILPESLVKYILKLQEDNQKYKKELLEELFKKTDFSILNN